MKYANGQYTFSATEIETFMLCHKRFFLQKIKDLPTDWDETPLYVGTIFHLSRQSYPLSLVALESIKKKIPIKDYVHLQNLCKLKNPEGVDPPFYADEIMIQTKIGLASVRGKIDRLGVQDDQLILIDWKTAKAKPDKSTLEKMQQYNIYSILAADEFAWKKDIIFKYVFFQKRGAYVTDVIEIKLNSGEVEKQKNILAQVVTDVILFNSLYKENDEGKDIVPYPNDGDTNKCFVCPYRKRCESERSESSIQEVLL